MTTPPYLRARLLPPKVTVPPALNLNEIDRSRQKRLTNSDIQSNFAINDY